MPAGNSHIWQALEAELELWQAAGHRARLWLRDDDAIDVSNALDRLTTLTDSHHVPVTLAVIPAGLTTALATHVKATPHLHPATHGFSHTDHAGDGEKKIELGGTRTVEAVAAELVQSRARMTDAFGSLSPDILVPPWNRIAPQVVTQLRELGFEALSTFGWRSCGAPVPELNTQVDLIDWKAGRAAKPLDTLITDTAEALHIARSRDYAPVGILSHHLVHGDETWAALEAILGWTHAHPAIDWVSSAELLGSQVSL